MAGPVLGSGDTIKNSDGIISAFRAENLSSSGEKRQTTMTAWQYSQGGWAVSWTQRRDTSWSWHPDSWCHSINTHYGLVCEKHGSTGPVSGDGLIESSTPRSQQLTRVRWWCRVSWQSAQGDNNYQAVSSCGEGQRELK